jgi:phage tail protein X
MPVVIPQGGASILQPAVVGQYVNPAQPTAGVIYAAQGERWDLIAWKMYGDASQISDLILSNPGIPIQDTVNAGSQVFVPIITPPAAPASSTPWS